MGIQRADLALLHGSMDDLSRTLMAGRSQREGKRQFDVATNQRGEENRLDRAMREQEFGLRREDAADARSDRREGLEAQKAHYKAQESHSQAILKNAGVQAGIKQMNDAFAALERGVKNGTMDAKTASARAKQIVTFMRSSPDAVIGQTPFAPLLDGDADLFQMPEEIKPKPYLDENGNPIGDYMGNTFTRRPAPRDDRSDITYDAVKDELGNPTAEMKPSRIQRKVAPGDLDAALKAQTGGAADPAAAAAGVYDRVNGQLKLKGATNSPAAVPARTPAPADLDRALRSLDVGAQPPSFQAPPALGAPTSTAAAAPAQGGGLGATKVMLEAGQTRGSSDEDLLQPNGLFDAVFPQAKSLNPAQKQHLVQWISNNPDASKARVLLVLENIHREERDREQWKTRGL